MNPVAFAIFIRRETLLYEIKKVDGWFLIKIEKNIYILKNDLWLEVKNI